MHRRLGLLAMTFALLSAPARADDPTGLWWAEGGAAQVRIDRCGAAFCGRVVWLRSPFDAFGCALRDAENPEPALREREVIGLELLRGLRASPAADGWDGWDGGEIYDPGSGRTYRAAARLDGPDRLQLRGYLGIHLLGRTTTWIRVDSEPVCRAEAPFESAVSVR